MTPEQAKQLKKGDKILVEAKVVKIFDDGDIQLECNYRQGVNTAGVMPENVTLFPEKPKYDPCRLFKKGDRVRMKKELAGRDVSDAIAEAGFSLGTIYNVLTDENHRNVVKLTNDNGCDKKVYWAYLELFTPVEELEPYHLNEIYDIDDGNLIGYEVARGDMRDTIFYGGAGHLRTIEQAKARAEAERARLNAEYRKEQA